MEDEDTDLRKFLISKEPIEFNKEHLRLVIYNLICAINFCHVSNVIHRDIKPSNILVGK